MGIRKYMTEFGVNMFGSKCLLLQQDQLDRLRDEPFASTPYHIYMVTRRPRITLEPSSLQFDSQTCKGVFHVQRGNTFEAHTFEIPNHLGTTKLRVECPYPHTEFEIFNEKNEPVLSGKAALLVTTFRQFWNLLSLEVLYVGQSYGVEGERTAPDRLKNHSTLQGIYAEAMRRSPDQDIWLLLWSFEQLLNISIDGITKDYGTSDDTDNEHIQRVLSRNITEQQQINFTEAALIRYFEPEYNKMFKDSFPSPAHKTYSECYDLDINFVAVELQTQTLMCQIWSPKVAPTWTHYAVYLLHSPDERRSMFDLSG